ncbi:MAG: hypothetical protein ACR2HR_09405 [Euzebya sp.]
MRSFLSLWLAVALLASACVGGGAGRAGQVTAGQVQRLDGRSWVDVARVGPGDEIRAVTDASVQIAAASITLRRGTEGRIIADGVALAVGDVLVEGTGAVVELMQSTISGSGAYRVQTGVAPRLAVYRGGTEVRRPAEAQRVNALRQLDLSSRRLDGTDEPLSYAAEDLFDQLQIPDAIAFDGQVKNLVNAIDNTYGAEPQPPGFYTSFVSVAEPDVAALSQAAPIVAPDGRFGPPADALVGLFLARAAADASGRDLSAAVATIRTLRSEGARWGLVFLTLGVNGIDFAGIVDRAVAQREVAEAATVTTPPAPASAPAAPTGGPVITPPAPDPVGQPAPDPDPTVPPPPPPPSEGPGPVQSILQDVLDAIPDPLGLGLGD